MKCVIQGNHVKVFGRAIHSLSKIGDELYLEWLEAGLALRTVNSSRSAYSCYLFYPVFFIGYADGKQSGATDSEQESLKCKIAMKSCVSVFRSLSVIEKTVERCKLTLDLDEARLVFQLFCRHGIVKTHNLAFIECETLQAVFSQKDNTNHLTAQAKLLCDVVASFQNNQDEITLNVVTERVSFKNYCDDDAPEANKMMRTELNLSPDEFDTYDLQNETNITFCLKELRAILSFCEATNLPLSLHFDSAGKPVIFSIDGDKLFSADFVLATLADSVANECSQEVPSRTTATTTNGNKSQSDGLRQRARTKDNQSSDVREGWMPVQSSQLNSQPVPENNNPLLHVCNNAESYTRSPSPVIPRLTSDANTSIVADVHLNEDDDNLDLNDTVPGTPPSKKFKALFFGMSQLSSQSVQHHSEVLAADSDDDG